MKRWMFFSYGVACYLLFLGLCGYFTGFVGNVLVPKSLDSAPAGALGTAIAVNLGLLALFTAQHSIMARPAFKRLWTRIVPQPVERSTYVLFSCLAVAVLIWQWRTIDGIVWDVQTPVLRTLLWILFATGWLMIPAVSLLIDHFDLFGLRQVWLHARGLEYRALPFRTPLVYARVRHPLYVGWAIAFWATPTMTVGHALFASVMTLYMVLAVLVEERDLVSHFGAEYRAYQQRVPKFIPRLRRRTAASDLEEVIAAEPMADACRV